MEKKQIKENLKDLPLKQLQKKLIVQERDLQELYKKQTLSKLDNYYKIVQARRNFARLKTFIRLKELSAGKKD